MKQIGKQVAAWLTIFALVLGLAPAVLAADENLLQDGSFEGDVWGAGIWALEPERWETSDTVTLKTTTETARVKDGSQAIDYWTQKAQTFTISQQVTLEPGKYTLTADIQGEKNTPTLFVGDVATGEVSLTGWGTWDTGKLNFEISEEKEYTVGVKLGCQDGGWGYLDNMILTKTGETEPEPQEGYVVKVTPSETSVEVGSTVTLTATVTNNGSPVTDLTAEGLDLWFWPDQWQSGHTDGLIGVSPSDNSGKVFSVTFTLPEVGTYYLAAQLKKGNSELAVAFAVVTTVAAAVPVEPVPAKIYVPYVTNDPDFIRGADVSSLLSILNSGAHYYDKNGNMLGTAGNVDSQGKAFMALLKESGVNWVRLRVWNNPFDSNGKGYGGGNNDIEAAKRMGKWATDAGLKVLIDFHYSDFWADPGKQQAPKTWSIMSVSEKAAAITTFTTESLNTLINAGVDVGMVQVGNETNNGMAGASGSDMYTLFAAGCDAVHAVATAKSKTILAAIHFTNPEKGDYLSRANNLANNKVNYDVFATSYYPYWHGTLENLTNQLTAVANKGVKVMVAETSWAWTLDDGDGHGNTVSVGSNDTGDNNNWPFSVQGQALEFADVATAVKNVGDAGLGLFYWENAWIPVNDVSKLSGAAYQNQVNANKALWEEHGSGWASSYAKEYDPKDAGVWYGGSAVDNQAMFDFTGKALESLKVFKYMQTGTKDYKNKIEQVESFAIEVTLGGTYTLPTTATVTYTDTTTATLTITWDGSKDTVDVNKIGTYTVTGTVTDGTNTVTVTCTVTVLPENLLQNPSFESSTMTMYTATNWPGDKRTNKEDNAHSGSYYYHFYSGTAFENATLEQTITLEAGTYHFSLYGQGGNMGTNHTYIYVKYGGEELTKDFTLTGWHEWKNPEIEFEVSEDNTQVTVGVSVSAGAGAWGSFDDWYLYMDPPCAHSRATHVAAKAPTCTEDGNHEHWYCPDCGRYFNDSSCSEKITQADTVDPAIGSHELEEVPYQDSTTTATGNKQHWKCTVCGKLFLDENGETETTLSDVTIARKSSGGSTSPSRPSTPDVSTGETEEGNLTTTAKPSATTNGTSAKAEVSGAMGNEMVKQAEKNSSDTVVVAPKVREDVTETQVTIPGDTLGQLADKTDADLRVETPVCDVTIPNGVLSELSEGVVTVTTRQDEEMVSVEITVDGKKVESVSSKLIVETQGEGYGPGTVAVIVHDDGTEEIIPTSFVDSRSGGMIIPVGGSITVKIVDNSQIFDDVDSDTWLHDSVAFSASRRLMIGTSETEFSPDEETTRGMFVTVLYRLAGQPEVGAPSFDDVEEDLWYSDAIAWAAANGIVNGNGDGSFGPDDVVTREQMIAILYRYAERIGAVKSDAYDEPDFSDFEEISDYAKDYVSWAAAVGIIEGMDDGVLDPQGTTTRAQVAAVFERLCVKFYPYI